MVWPIMDGAGALRCNGRVSAGGSQSFVAITKNELVVRVNALRISSEAYICEMGRQFSHLFGTTGMLLTMLLWLPLLNPPKADHFVDNLAGSQHEYKIVLGAALLSTVFSFIAAIRASKWWYVGVVLSSATLAFFTYSLSA
jgi:hypothetical protein